VSFVAEKSLLQQIREKELILNIKIEDTRKEAEEIILKARKDAADMIENSEKEGKKAAEEYYLKEMERLKQEIEQLRNQGNQRALKIKADGEHNLPAAIENIEKAVLTG
jgi:vacuolar-type H+-ATPase subunit H